MRVMMMMMMMMMIVKVVGTITRDMTICGRRGLGYIYPIYQSCLAVLHRDDISYRQWISYW